MILIEEVNFDQAGQVLDLVTGLLEELREEPGERVTLDRDRIMHNWEQNRDRFAAFVALAENGTPLGIVTLQEAFAIYADGTYGIINELYVPPEHRNKNVGKMLLETAKDYGRYRHWRRIDVTAPLGEKWERTVKFYEREGFVMTGPKLKFKY